MQSKQNMRQKSLRSSNFFPQIVEGKRLILKVVQTDVSRLIENSEIEWFHILNASHGGDLNELSCSHGLISNYIFFMISDSPHSGISN